MTEPAFTIDVENRLGEDPIWDDRLGRLWWTDILASRLYHWDWDSRETGFVELPERLGSLGLTNDAGTLVCAFETGFALFKPASEKVDWIARPEQAKRGIRFNDGRVDRMGRFWAGTMIEDEDQAQDSTASVYRLDPNGSVERVFDGVGISNGICFSPDGETMYFSDSPIFGMWRFDLGANGSVANRKPFHLVATGGHPDGADVDSEGNIWSAEWGSSRVTCYSPEGAILETLTVPASQPTCPAFGGPAMDHMFVTTAREALPEVTLGGEPHSGKVLAYKTVARGLPAPRFNLEGLSP